MQNQRNKQLSFRVLTAIIPWKSSRNLFYYHDLNDLIKMWFFSHLPVVQVLHASFSHTLPSLSRHSNNLSNISLQQALLSIMEFTVLFPFSQGAPRQSLLHSPNSYSLSCFFLFFFYFFSLSHISLCLSFCFFSCVSVTIWSYILQVLKCFGIF